MSLCFGQLKSQLDSLGCSGILGDTKHSILQPDDFQSLNGNCWILMEGQNISSSKLGALGFSNLPDPRGYFIRIYDNRQSGRIDIDRNFGVPIGTVQADQFKSHYHTGRYKNSNAALEGPDDGPASPNLRGWDTGASNTGLQTGHPTLYAGGSETRPKNITLYLYIRIN